MLHTQYVPAPWVPKFVDYLSLGFWTATAFSPTDISAIRPWAKLLMITEAAVSLGIAGLVIARAISGVDRPPSRRSVSATRASRDKTGWHVMKIRRSTSSCTSSTCAARRRA